MFIKLVGSSGHVNYIKIDDIVAIQICEDWDKEGHIPRIDVVTGAGGIELEYSEANIDVLKLAEFIDKKYIYIPKPDGWKKPERPKSAMEFLTEQMEAKMRRISEREALDIQLEDELDKEPH